MTQILMGSIFSHHIYITGMTFLLVATDEVTLYENPLETSYLP